jgi:UDP-glucose 4-epimerase
MIIVAGACGFVGFYLVKQLLDEGYTVMALDKYVTDESKFLVDRGASFVALDITKEDEFEKLPKQGVDAVVNLACIQPANMPSEECDPAKYISVNILGVANILKYCHKNSIKKMLHTISHRNVQGLWEQGTKITEASPRSIKYTGKFAMFSISESAAADVIEYYNQQHEMNCVIFRLPSVYGFGHHENVLVEGREVKTGLGVFIANAMSGATIEIWGDRDKGRDVVYVKDVVAAIVLALRNPGVSGMFNIASGKALTLQSQVESVVKVFSSQAKPPQIMYRPERPNSIDACVYDISKAEKVLGWRPRYSFEEMLVDYKIEMERGQLDFLLSRKRRMVAEELSGI